MYKQRYKPCLTNLRPIYLIDKQANKVMRCDPLLWACIWATLLFSGFDILANSYRSFAYNDMPKTGLTGLKCLIQRVFPHTRLNLYSRTSTLPRCLCLHHCCLPLSPADCRFYHIWSYTAPCLTAFQDHFLPALPLAATSSAGTHVNTGIGWKRKRGQDERAVF